MPMVVSVLFFLLYYIISITGEKFVREGILPSYQGMWLSSVILLPLGIFLTYKATTDSAVLNIDTYMNFFKRIIKLKNKKSSN
jgi:lipopolysaccharide export system permease protein